MKIRIIGVVLFALISISVNAQLSGGGDLNPDLKAPKEAQEKWMDLRIGLSVHWGPSALGAEEISWSRHSKIPKETYDNYYKEFNPDKFDANEWAKLMKRWGIKYMAPTGKHHDGFCLWFSDYTEYDMENAKLKIDIMAELAKACKKHNIMFGSYYSNLDWYHPDWYPYLYGGPGELFERYDDTPNLERYYKFFENQVVELIEKYDIDFFQFDGEWDSTYTHEVGSRLYRRFHEVKPDVLLSSRIDIGRRSAGMSNHLDMDGLKYAGDYQERERLVNHGNNVVSWLDHPWQAWVTIDKTQWAYNLDPVLMSFEELIADLVSVIGNNGNYMINLGPRPDGSFEPEQIALMDQMGAWLKEHAETVYGTRGGPFYPFPEGVSTRKGKKAWIFVLDNEATKLTLPKLPQEIKSAKVFKSKNKVVYTTKDDLLMIDLPAKKEGEPMRVIELNFDENVEMSTVKELPNKYEQAGANLIVEGITYELSSKDKQWHNSEKEHHIFDEKEVDNHSFHTESEKQPFIKIDLGSEKEIHGILIKNRTGCCQERAKNLTIWLSNDGKNWKEYWRAKNLKDEWDVTLTTNSMGATVPGAKTRYIKIGTVNKKAQALHLNKIQIFGK
ncbi:MAG: alpha-L-fucosidase [Carboxylicivirga sp.]|jgi:alpha-L-fucosidase|nr:alpha-L-fucosidase [Carboxylicivirga sp.]